MEVINTTGKSTTTGSAKLTKGIESLVIGSDLQFSGLTTEKIKIVVQRTNDDNLEITKGWMLLRDFLLLGSYGASAIACDVDGKLSVVCDLTDGGNYRLLEKDEIQIDLMGLKTANSWTVDAMESFQPADKIYTYEQKIIADTERQRDVLVHDAHLAVLDNAASVVDIRFTYFNGTVVTYTNRELRAMSRQVDPIALIDNAGAIKTGFADKIQMPLVGVDSIQINKDAGATFNVFLRGEA